MRKFIAIAVALTTALMVFTSCADTETDAETEDTEEHVHSWIDSTCTEPDTCSICGATRGSANGHTVEEWTTVVEATCTSKGEKTGVCTVCGETVTQETSRLNHEYEWEITEDATCTSNGTNTGTCTYCGYTVEKSIQATGHKYGEWETIREPTCSVAGEESKTCTVCGYTYTASISKQKHTEGEWVITKAATSDSEGERTLYCSVCGEAIKTEPYSATAKEIEEMYKEQCVWYTYETIARNPDSYVGTYGKYTGEVIQVLECCSSVVLQVNITEGKYSYSDTIYVTYTMKDGESRILEDDIITIYGVNNGLYSYTSVIGTTVTLPYVKAEYIDLVG